jgi:uncharacterized protein
MTEGRDRLEKIADFVNQRLQRTAQENPGPGVDPVYRWQHTLRVSQYGLQIAKAEGADPELAVAGCLLHDVAHFDPMESYVEHGRIGAQIARPLLISLNYSPQQIDELHYAIAVHVDGKAGYEHEHTLLAKVVSDSDNIDRFGAYRILQWCVLEMDKFPQLAEKLSERILRLKKYRQESPLETETGSALFARQLDLQIAVFQGLVNEWASTKLPSDL